MLDLFVKFLDVNRNASRFNLNPLIQILLMLALVKQGICQWEKIGEYNLRPLTGNIVAAADGVFNSDDNLLYIADFHQPAVSVIDLDLNSVIRSIELEGVIGYQYWQPCDVIFYDRSLRKIVLCGGMNNGYSFATIDVDDYSVQYSPRFDFYSNCVLDEENDLIYAYYFNTVRVYSITNFSLLRTIYFPNSIIGLPQYDFERRKIFVSHDDTSLSIYDLETMQLVTEIEYPSDMGEFNHSEYNRFHFVQETNSIAFIQWTGNEGSVNDRISFYSITDEAYVGVTHLDYLRVPTHGNRLYYNASQNQYYFNTYHFQLVIDANSYALTNTLPTLGMTRYDRDMNRILYLPPYPYNAGNITVRDMNTFATFPEIVPGASPHSIAIDIENNVLLVTNMSADRLYKIDANSGNIIQDLRLDRTPYSVVLDTTTNRAFVSAYRTVVDPDSPSYLRWVVYVVDVNDWEIVNVIDDLPPELIDRPQGLAINYNTRRLIVSTTSDKILYFNIDAYSIRDRVQLFSV